MNRIPLKRKKVNIFQQLAVSPKIASTRNTVLLGRFFSKNTHTYKKASGFL